MSKAGALKLVAAVLFAVGTCVAAYAEPVHVRFAGLGGEAQNGVYTYPYYLTINNGAPMPMICDDYLHQSNVGDTWLANITSLAAGDLSDTRFNDLTKYEEAGFLLMQINHGNQLEWGNINFAIWKIFDPKLDMGPVPPGSLGPQFWYDLAMNTDLSSIDFSGVKILTPTQAHHKGGDQEFLYLTPEPGTLLLIGGGLLGLFSQRRLFV